MTQPEMIESEALCSDSDTMYTTFNSIFQQKLTNHNHSLKTKENSCFDPSRVLKCFETEREAKKLFSIKKKVWTSPIKYGAFRKSISTYIY